LIILLSWPLSVGLGLFIDGLVRQGRERARLILELQATRQQLAEASRQAGIMQERQRLACDIHDTFTQGLSSIVMQIVSLARIWRRRAVCSGPCSPKRLHEPHCPKCCGHWLCVGQRKVR
jgi:signal transduction histidine kinase